MKGIAINKMVEMIIAVIVIGVATMLIVKYVNLKPVDLRMNQTKLCSEYMSMNPKCDPNFIPPSNLVDIYEETQKNLTRVCKELGYQTIKQCCSC